MDYKVKSPIAMIVFNRYEKALQVFEKIRIVQPSKLFVIADGPRKNNPADIEKCKKVRSIFDEIDWPCELIRFYSDINLGCSKRPFTGISSVFENEEEAIILEDDCLPDISFFEFCDTLLEKYKYDHRIMLISGTNINTTWYRGENSYHFSKLGGIHGWASWKRSWEKMDIEIKQWDDVIVKKLLEEKLSKRLFFFRAKVYDSLCNNSSNVTAWDYQFGFSRLINNGLAIVPCINLIKNIGFDDESTHTNDSNSKAANLMTHTMSFPLKHPQYLMEDYLYDEVFEKVLYPLNIKFLIKVLFKKIIKKI